MNRSKYLAVLILIWTVMGSTYASSGKDAAGAGKALPVRAEILTAVRMTGSELLQERQTLTVRVDSEAAGGVVVSFRRRAYGIKGKPGQPVGEKVEVTFSKDRITLRPGSALTRHARSFRRDCRLTEVACLALSSVGTGYLGSEFEMDISRERSREYSVLIEPLPAVPGRHVLVLIEEVRGKLRFREIVPGK